MLKGGKNMEFSQLEGKTLTKIEKVINGSHIEELYFSTVDEQFHMYHDQDCCESVYLEDIIGDLNDLIGKPILMAYEASNHDKVTEAIQDEYKYLDSETWTFYHLATIKGYVTLRWVGSSNGYYSESVTFDKEN